MLVYNFHTKVFYVSSLYRRYVTLRYVTVRSVTLGHVTIHSAATRRAISLRFVTFLFHHGKYKVNKSSVRDQKLRVGLPIFKHNKQCRIRCVVTTGVIQHMGIG